MTAGELAEAIVMHGAASAKVKINSSCEIQRWTVLSAYWSQDGSEFFMDISPMGDWEEWQ